MNKCILILSLALLVGCVSNDNHDNCYIKENVMSDGRAIYVVGYDTQMGFHFDDRDIFNTLEEAEGCLIYNHKGIGL